MWANLVTELIGILITVGWVDRMIKKREREEIKPSLEYVYKNILMSYSFLNFDLPILRNKEKYDDDKILMSLTRIKINIDSINEYVDKYPELIEINHRTKLDGYLKMLEFFSNTVISSVQNMGSDYNKAINEYISILDYEKYWEIREELIEFYKSNFPEKKDVVTFLESLVSSETEDV